MHVFAAENVETFLVLLIRNTISHSATEHHLIALGEIVHHVLQLRHVRFLIYQVKVDVLIRRNLNPYILLDKVNEAAYFDLMVQLPTLLPCV